jgi:hypothetical protein
MDTSLPPSDSAVKTLRTNRRSCLYRGWILQKVSLEVANHRVTSRHNHINFN